MIPLYHRILKEQYAVLPEAVRQLHNVQVETRYYGTCRIRRGTNRLSNFFAMLLSLPKTGDDIAVTIDCKADGEKEIWSRSFHGELFKSIQWQVGDFLYERLNFTTLVFTIAATREGLNLQLQQVYIFGLSLIRLLRPVVIARETQKEGRFHFFIRASLPFLGLLVEYEGSLDQIA